MKRLLPSAWKQWMWVELLAFMSAFVAKAKKAADNRGLSIYISTCHSLTHARKQGVPVNEILANLPVGEAIRENQSVYLPILASLLDKYAISYHDVKVLRFGKILRAMAISMAKRGTPWDLYHVPLLEQTAAELPDVIVKARKTVRFNSRITTLRDVLPCMTAAQKCDISAAIELLCLPRVDGFPMPEEKFKDEDKVSQAPTALEERIRVCRHHLEEVEVEAQSKKTKKGSLERAQEIAYKLLDMLLDKL